MIPAVSRRQRSETAQYIKDSRERLYSYLNVLSSIDLCVKVICRIFIRNKQHRSKLRIRFQKKK